MHVFYINLDHRTDRQQEMTARFAALGLSADRISAVSLSDLSPDQKAQYCDPMSSHYVREVELCCALSHLKAMQALIDSDAPYGLILEDDVLLSASLPAFLSEVDQRGMTCEILRIESDLKGHRFSPKIEERFGDIEVRQSWSWGTGSAAYVLSRQAAQELLASPKFLHMQVDTALFNPYKPIAKKLRVKQTVPGLAVQEYLIDKTEGWSDMEQHRQIPWQIPGWLKAWRKVTGIFETEIIHGSQRQFHVLFGKARKSFLPFKQQ